MEKIFIKKLGVSIENNEENRPLLLKYGCINDVENNKGTRKPANIDIVRVGKRKSSK